MDNAESDRQIIQLSIVIISYNTINFTEDCLRSIYQEAINKYFEVIVLDNASADGSVARIADLFPQVRLIRGEKNHGFAVGNNIAAAEARGEWLLLLNPDTVIQGHAIDTLLQFAPNIRKHQSSEVERIVQRYT